MRGTENRMAGKIQETYGITKEATEKQISEWQSHLKDMSRPK